MQKSGSYSIMLRGVNWWLPPTWNFPKRSDPPRFFYFCRVPSGMGSGGVPFPVRQKRTWTGKVLTQSMKIGWENLNTTVPARILAFLMGAVRSPSSRNDPGLADAITLLRGFNAGPSGRMNSGEAFLENRIEATTGAPLWGRRPFIITGCIRSNCLNQYIFSVFFWGMIPKPNWGHHGVSGRHRNSFCKNSKNGCPLSLVFMGISRDLLRKNI